MPSLLVTNDFPPKHGGIQSYLYELWRRLPPAETTVLTTAFPHADVWDRDQAFRIERVRQRVLLPTRRLRDRIDALAREVRADVVFLDPMFPLGLVGPHARRRRRTSSSRTAPRSPATAACRCAPVRAAGAAARPASSRPGRIRRARRCGRPGAPLPGVVIPPGVDLERFRPVDDETRKLTRRGSASTRIVRWCSGCRGSFPARASTS